MRRLLRMGRTRLFPVLVLSAFVAGEGALAQASPPPQTSPPSGLAQVRASYTKYEYMVPMRDGVRLFTSVYSPKDAARTYPILITRTPYSVAPYGVDNYRDSLGPSE
ncbi:MAG: hypothetical protein ABJC51_07335, partial [Acidobacteriota bacterium]